ncbi:MAG: glycosyltransferase family 9 protein, partial [Candidatus Solibacter usitatus]|nr:glycosyltransferase family 9 protein [Candidatus Solibacter usitatus]
AVIRLRSLGDCVLSTPALALLKQHRQDLCVGVAVEPAFRAIFDGNPNVDEILPPTANAVRTFRPDVTLNLHGGTRSMFMTLASGAKIRAGFRHHRYSWVYHEAIPRAQEILGVDRRVHTAEHLASAMFYLGVPQTEIPRAGLYAPKKASAKPYAVIHPKASLPEKTWPGGRFLELAEMLRRQCDLDCVFIGGLADDLSEFTAFPISRTPLRETMSLLAGASLFAGNDSGPAHMAAAFGIPSVVLFGASDPVAWAPWKATAETLVAAEGMDSISVTQVVEAASRLLVKV